MCLFILNKRVIVQLEGDKELQNVRACLSEHVRIAPEVTYSTMMEYLGTDNDGNIRKGPLTEKILAYISGGGIYTLETNGVAVGQDSPSLYRRLDTEGGKGAILEVSWLQNNLNADSILTEGFHRVSHISTPNKHDLTPSFLRSYHI
jgi:hypothetical protein